MRQDIPSYAAILDTLRRAEQGYVTGPEGALHPMPWRRILDHLAVLGPDDLLHISPGVDGIAVRRIAANGRAGANPSGEDIAQHTVCTVDTRVGLRAKARFAQRIEIAARSGECLEVTCVREGFKARALTAHSKAAAPPQERGPIREVADRDGTATGIRRGRAQNTRYPAASLLFLLLAAPLAGHDAERRTPRLAVRPLPGYALHVTGAGFNTVETRESANPSFCSGTYNAICDLATLRIPFG